MPEAQTVNSKLTPSIPLEKTLTAKKQVDELIVRAYNSANYQDFSTTYANVWSWAESVLKPEEIILIKRLDPYAQSLIREAQVSGKNADWERQRLELLELEAYLLILINKVNQDSAPASIHEVVSRYDQAMAEAMVTPDEKTRLIQNLNISYSHLNYYNQIIQQITVACRDAQISPSTTNRITDLYLQNPNILTEDVLPSLTQIGVSNPVVLASEINSQIQQIAPPIVPLETNLPQNIPPPTIYELIKNSTSTALVAHGVELSADQIESLIADSQTYPPDQLETILVQFVPEIAAVDRRQLAQTLVLNQLIAPSLQDFLNTRPIKPDEAVNLISTLSSQLSHDPGLLVQSENFLRSVSEKTQLSTSDSKTVITDVISYLNSLNQTAVAARLIPPDTSSPKIISALGDSQQQNLQMAVSLTNSILSSLPDPNSPLSQTLTADILSGSFSPDYLVNHLMETKSGKSRQEVEGVVQSTLNQPVVAQYRQAEQLTRQLFQNTDGFASIKPEDRVAVLNQIIHPDSPEPDQNTDILAQIHAALSEASPAVIKSAAVTASRIATQDPKIGQLTEQILTQNPQSSLGDIKNFLISNNVDAKQATIVSKSAYDAFRSAATSTPIIITPPTQPAPQAIAALVRNQLQIEPDFEKLPTQIQNDIFSNIQKAAAEKGSQLEVSDIQDILTRAKLPTSLSSQTATEVIRQFPKAISQTTTALNSAVSTTASLATQYQIPLSQSESIQSVVQTVLSAQPLSTIPQLATSLVQQVGISQDQATNIAGNAILGYTIEVGRTPPVPVPIPQISPQAVSAVAKFQLQQSAEFTRLPPSTQADILVSLEKVVSEKGVNFTAVDLPKSLSPTLSTIVLSSLPTANLQTAAAVNTAVNTAVTLGQSAKLPASQVQQLQTVVREAITSNTQISSTQLRDLLINQVGLTSIEAAQIANPTQQTFGRSVSQIPVLVTPSSVVSPQAAVASARDVVKSLNLEPKTQFQVSAEIEKLINQKGVNLTAVDYQTILTSAGVSFDTALKHSLVIDQGIKNQSAIRASIALSAVQEAVSISTIQLDSTPQKLSSEQISGLRQSINQLLTTNPATDATKIKEELTKIGLNSTQAAVISKSIYSAHKNILSSPAVIQVSTSAPPIQLVTQVLAKQTLISQGITLTPEIQSHINIFAQNVSDNPAAVDQHLQTFVSALKLPPSQTLSPTQINQLRQSVITTSTSVSPASVVINHVLATKYSPDSLTRIQPYINHLAQISVTSSPQKIRQYIDQKFIPEISQSLGLPVNLSVSRQISDYLVKLSQIAPTVIPATLLVSQTQGFSPKDSQFITSSALEFVVKHPLSTPEQISLHLQSLRLELNSDEADRISNLVFVASDSRYSPAVNKFLKSFPSIPSVTSILPDQFKIYSQTYEKFLKLSGISPGTDQYRLFSGLSPLLISGLAQEPIQTLGSFTNLVQSVSPQNFKHLVHLANLAKNTDPVLQNLYLITNNSLILNNLIDPAKAHEVSLGLLLLKTSRPDITTDQIQSYLEKQYRYIPKTISRSLAQQLASFRLHFDLSKPQEVDLFIHQTLTAHFSQWISTQAADKIARLFVEHNLHRFTFAVAGYYYQPGATAEEILSQRAGVIRVLTHHGLEFLSQKYPQQTKEIGILIDKLNQKTAPVINTFNRLYGVYQKTLGKIMPLVDTLTRFSPENLIALGQSYFQAYVQKKIIDPAARYAMQKFFSSQFGQKITSFAAGRGMDISSFSAAKTSLRTAVKASVEAGIKKATAKIAAKIGIKALSQLVGTLGNAIAPVISQIIAFLVGLFLEKILDFLKKAWDQTKEFVGGMTVVVSQAAVLVGAIILAIPALIVTSFILPVVLSSIGFISLVIFILYIINNSAYVVPYTVNQLTYNATPTPYPIDKIGPPPPTPRPPGWGTGPIAGFGGGGSGGGSFNCSSSCPIQKGRITTTSYNASNESGHGSNAYWNAMCGNGGCTACFAYSLPQSTGCTGPSSGVANPANICYQNPTTNKCPTYGYAIDVFPSTDSNVYLPLLNGQSVTWSSCGGFLNPCRPGVTPGTCVGVTAFYCSGSSKIILTHINSGYLTGVYPSGTQIGSLFPQGGNTHLHLEAIINGSYVPPENYFCSGDTAVCAPIGVNCWCATIGCTPGSCWWSDAASAGPYICPNISCGPYIPPQPTSTPVPTTCNFPNYCLSSQRECYDDFGGVVGPRYNCPSGQFCCITQ